MNFPGRIRSYVEEEPRKGADEHAVRQEAIERLTRFGGVDFLTDGDTTTFAVERSWAGSANPLRYARGGAFRITRVRDAMRIDYRIDMPLSTLVAWAGLCVAGLAVITAIVTFTAVPALLIAFVFGCGTLFDYALNCSHAQDLFKSAVRRAGRTR